MNYTSHQLETTEDFRLLGRIVGELYRESRPPDHCWECPATTPDE